MKKALITGLAGQDGSFLSEFLLEKDYDVYGVVRPSNKHINHLDKRIKLYRDIDITKKNSLKSLITEIEPDEIYHLAAYHFSSQNEGNKNKLFDKFYLVNLFATNEILETIQNNLPKCRFFYASSCHIFGKVDVIPQNEKTPIRPNSLYAITKAAGTNLCQFYREHFDIYTSVGILYNHESFRRSMSFVTSQIAESAAKASIGLPTKFFLQNMDAKVDWGSAQDYVRAMWLTLQQSNGDDYVIASGETHTISEFAKIAFDSVGLDFSDYIFQKTNVKKNEAMPYVGDYTKISSQCNWNPLVSFNNLVCEMVQYHLSKFRNK